MQEFDLSRIQELIEKGDSQELIRLHDEFDLHPADWAENIEQLGSEDLARYIDLIGPGNALPFFEFVSFELQKEVLHLLSRQTLAALISIMSPDDRADLVEEVDEEMKDYILSLLIRAERQNLLKLINYPEDSAGAYMTTEYAMLRYDDRVFNALERLRLQAPKKETIYYIYVVDKALRLIGCVSLRQLIMSPRNRRVEEVMDKNVIAVQVDEDIEDVAQQMRHYDFLAMPVIAPDQRMVGLITFDDIYDVIQEEATEDMYHLANLDTDETIETTLTRSVKLRVPWLFINLCTALLVAYTVDLFSETISKFVILAAMMPLVGMIGGNAGNQALVVVVRALALGEINIRENWRVLFKELGVGFFNGFIVGAVMGTVSYLWYKNLWLSLILWVAMTTNLVVAGIFGSMVPLILRKCKLDPALGSSIFVTTATDVFGFFIFLGLSTLLLARLLAA